MFSELEKCFHFPEVYFFKHTMTPGTLQQIILKAYCSFFSSKYNQDVVVTDLIILQSLLL